MKSKKTKSNKKEVGTTLPSDWSDSKNVKERITIYIDQDILDAARMKAGEMNMGYQTLLNLELRKNFAPIGIIERSSDLRSGETSGEMISLRNISVIEKTVECVIARMAEDGSFTIGKMKRAR